MASIKIVLIFFINFHLAFARFSDEHALHIHHKTMSNGNVFVPERRHIGFTKFVGAGDASAIYIKAKQPSRKLRQVLTRIALWSRENGNMLDNWLITFDDKQKQTVNPIKPKNLQLGQASGSTQGWYYGSTSV